MNDRNANNRIKQFSRSIQSNVQPNCSFQRTRMPTFQLKRKPQRAAEFVVRLTIGEIGLVYNRRMTTSKESQPSLELLIETENLNVEILHPGGLSITRELANLCRIRAGVSVLEVACGTGEAACFLTSEFGARVTGVDLSALMIERAMHKAREQRLNIDFQSADAHKLPFNDNSFFAVLSECAICHFDKERVIREMARVTMPRGFVGIHDLCWAEETPEELKQRLGEIEQEWPETAEGWKRKFEEAGLEEVKVIDKTQLLQIWTKEFKRKLGVRGYIGVIVKILRRWGVAGLRRILESERIFANKHMRYVIIVGKKP